MELVYREKVILYNLLSERYHELKNDPVKITTRDELVFHEIEDLYIKMGIEINSYGKA